MIVHRINSTLGVAPTLIFAVALGVSSASAQETLSLSSDITINQGGVVVQDEDVVVDNQLGIVVLENLGTLPNANDLMGHAMDANGDRLFTLANTANLAGGVIARGGDVIRYDGGNYSIEFDASQQGVPSGVRTDAVSVAPGGLLLSFDNTVNLGGLIAADEDLVRWDGDEFVLALDGSAAGVTAALDLDAAQDLGGGSFLVSLDSAGSVGGVNFADEDVLRYDGDTWSLEIDTSTVDTDWVAADLDAIFVPEPGAILGLVFGAVALAGAVRNRGGESSC